jgi:hypothetical protein
LSRPALLASNNNPATMLRLELRALRCQTVSSPSVMRSCTSEAKTGLHQRNAQHLAALATRQQL